MSLFWRNFIRAGVIFGLFLLILIINFADREQRRFFRLPSKIFSVPVYALGEFIEWMKLGWKRYVYLVNTQMENERLKRELLQKNLELNFAMEKLMELERIKSLLGYKELFQYSTIVANVTGYSSGGGYATLLIDRGENFGLKEGMPVVSSEGLVGIIRRVYPFSAEVLLITDKNISVDTFNIRTQEKFLLSGDGANGCRLKYYPRDGEASPGDVLVTAGLTEMFPKGISVGVITEVGNGKDGLFKEVKVKPFVNPSKVYHVLVIIKK